MGKFFVLALALTVSVATTVVVASSDLEARHGRNETTQMDSDGAFRDGLYVGRRAAESKKPFLPQVGRWSTAADRTSFVAGYKRGYGDALANASRNE
jgi:hypothetical protein